MWPGSTLLAARPPSAGPGHSHSLEKDVRETFVLEFPRYRGQPMRFSEIRQSVFCAFVLLCFCVFVFLCLFFFLINYPRINSPILDEGPVNLGL